MFINKLFNSNLTGEFFDLGWGSIPGSDRCSSPKAGRANSPEILPHPLARFEHCWRRLFVSWPASLPRKGLLSEQARTQKVLKRIPGINLKKSWIAILILCLSYWTYLFFTTQMAVQFDAADYVGIAQIIHDKGWVEFFKTGPHREPLYPLLISWSMDVGSLLGISYQWVQKIFQIGILLFTQLSVLLVLTKFRVREWIRLAVTAYIGFSPAIVNSTFSLFGEIMTYPFVMGILWLSFVSWRCLWQTDFKKIIVCAVLTALSFVLATYAKGVFQYVFLLYLIVLMAAGVWAARSGRGKILRNALIYAAVAFMVLNSCLAPFKWANKKYNGYYDLTNRFSDLLFGNAVKRTNPLSARMIAAHVADVPGGGVCRLFFSEEECYYCEFQKADFYRGVELFELRRNISKELETSKTISWAMEKVWRRPWQYVLLTFIETWRMAFWESTQLGNVGYPPGLQKIFEFVLFKNGLRLIMSLLTYAAIFYLFRFVWRSRSRLNDIVSFEAERVQVGFWLLFMIVAYTGLHSLFSIVTRYALPISFLYLLSIALVLDERINSKNIKTVRT